MADSSFEPPRDNNDDAPEIIHDLDKMIENTELISGGAIFLPNTPIICTPPSGLTAVCCVRL